MLASMKYAELLALSLSGGVLSESLAESAVQALADEDILTRQAAVTVLGASSDVVLRSAAAVAALKNLLSNSNAFVRAAAAHAVGTIGPGASNMAPLLLPLLAEPSSESGPGDEALVALQMGNGGQRLAPQFRRPKCAALTALGRLGATSTSQAVAEALLDEEWEVRLCAAEALGLLRSAGMKHMTALMASLEDEAFPVRSAACSSLGELRCHGALGLLAHALDDPSQRVRISALRAMGRLGDPADEHGHEVFKLVNDPEPKVRAEAVRTLSLLGEASEAYTPVIATLMLDQDEVVRCQALEAMPRLGEAGQAYVEEIHSVCTGDRSEIVRNTATAALERMGYSKPTAGQPKVASSRKVLDYAQHAPTQVQSPGLGSYFRDVQRKQKVLQDSGKWVEGIF